MIPMLKAGEGVDATCPYCSRAVQIVLEPSTINMAPVDRPKDTAKPNYCPFCGKPLADNDFEEPFEL